ncbi:helix-turn-helix domain-containing protein [Sulfitobacter mediterraneus]|uniref:helix-turn-helix domain-containing protein n=1 Tax=Sulfitobacter mediterraneus TaxID=83219 RepID=UPI0021A76F60|nr:helix-turn-helix domain-containing protein [Sulfitobacter mediterraneus]UWR10901.1 helix-turn-helix domain-containing protein [Sulfitobacter mediterraneus]
MSCSFGVHRELDARASVLALTEFAGMTLEDVAEEVGISRPTLSRIKSGQGAGRQDISGLGADVIRQLFATDSGVAEACQLLEHDMRIASFGHCDAATALRLIPLAEDRLRVFSESGEISMEAVDHLALASLEGQIALYKARATESDRGRLEHFRAAFQALFPQSDLIVRLFVLEDTVCDGDKLLGLRMLLNAFFAAWELDELEGNSQDLPWAKSVAEKFVVPSVLRKTRSIALKTQDPRLAYQMAEAAAVIGKVYAAADHLAAAIAMTGDDTTDPLVWNPAWLPTPIAQEAHFEEPIKLLMKRPEWPPEDLK